MSALSIQGRTSNETLLFNRSECSTIRFKFLIVIRVQGRPLPYTIKLKGMISVDYLDPLNFRCYSPYCFSSRINMDYCVVTRSLKD